MVARPARRLDAAGYAGLWAWDHFTGRGDLTVPVVENWTILSMAAGATQRVTIGSFVINVMNRHPALLARMAATLQIGSGGRHILGIGIGGGPTEHLAYGMEYPDAPERVRRLEEAVAVIRALWTGGPVSRESPFYPLDEAYARPVPDPPPPIIIGGETRAGARLAGRFGDGWTAFYDNFEANLPAYLEALEESGRARADQRLIVGFQGEDWLSDEPIAGSPGSRRRARSGRAGRRPAPMASSCWPGRRPTSTRWSMRSSAGRDRSWHHHPRDEPTNRDA